MQRIFLVRSGRFCFSIVGQRIRRIFFDAGADLGGHLIIPLWIERLYLRNSIIAHRKACPLIRVGFRIVVESLRDIAHVFFPFAMYEIDNS